MNTLVAAITLTGVTLLGLSGCAQPAAVPGSPAPAATPAPVAPSPATVVAPPPPSTVYMVPPPPQTVTVPAAPKAAQTSCQWLYANGYSYTAVLSIWAQENFPANWDADHDGYPCEQTYGNKN
jgi:hypothetical protein